MPRGGARAGAGGRFKWKHGKTKNIRVPEVLEQQILEYARNLDSGGIIEHETQSKVVTGIPVTQDEPLKVVDFSGISIYRYQEKSFVFLQDLIKLGYEIEPKLLADRVLEEIYRSQIKQGDKNNDIQNKRHK